MLYLILLPILASFLLIPIVGERHIKSYMIAIAGALGSLIVSVFYLFFNWGGSVTEFYNWFLNQGFILSFTGTNLTLSLAVLVSFISLMVMVFSVFYMKKEAQERYYVEMSVFVFSMLGLVLSSSLLLFYIFWELVGVSSYLLIGFWYKKESASAAGKKALILTRIGDVALLGAIIIIFVNLKTLSIPAIIGSLSLLSQPVLFLSGALILIAALSKSAQFPFYTWLPDAMEGPTPVSALLHSATMVAAGAYLLVLTYPLISAAGLNIAIISIGFVTAFIAALLALNHTHIKRILAYSTIESLSFMFIAVGTINAGGAVLYLFAHALFKSLLFLVSGVIAVLLGVQDIYLLKQKKLASTWLVIPAAIGFASMAGLPPFMSFFAHLALSVGFNIYENIFFVLLSFITALFAFRAFFVVFNGTSDIKLEKYFASLLPIALLAIGSVFGGITLFYFGNVIPGFAYSFDVFSLAEVLASVLGVVVAFELFYTERYDSLLASVRNFVKLASKYTYDSIITEIGAFAVLFGKWVAEFDDKLSRFYDKLADSSLLLSSNSRRVQSGDAQTYIIAITVGIVAILAIAAVYV